MEVRTRVIRDQLGVKLAKEAGVNFDAPQIVAEDPPPERRQSERPQNKRGPRENTKPNRAMPGRPDREARGGGNRFERDAAPRRAPPKPSMPERRRKHVSALRAEIAADAATTRKRIERSATHDRKGRTIAVERMSRAGEEARATVAPETRPKRSERPRTGERGGRAFEGGARAGRSDSFGPKRGRAAGGRERPPHSDPREPGRRPERANAARGEGGPRERRFDRPAAKRDGDRRERPSRARGGAEPARERKFDRPQGRTRPPAGEGRPPRSEDKSRGPRSDFKSRPPRAGARDGDRPQSPSRGARQQRRTAARSLLTRAAPSPARERAAERRRRAAPATAKAVIDADRRRPSQGPRAICAVVARHSSNLGATAGVDLRHSRAPIPWPDRGRAGG